MEGQEGTLVACRAGTGSTAEGDWVWAACELETWSPDDGGSQVFTVFINKQILTQLTQNRMENLNQSPVAIPPATAVPPS